MKTIKEAAQLAARILGADSQYIHDRAIIDKVFRISNQDPEKVLIRLTVIDSYYSTNMTRRLFGLVDLADAISQIGSDEKVRLGAERYLEKGDGPILSLLGGEYGIRKYGKVAGEARSLVSKYIYFLNGHGFPIEDTLVRNYANVLFRHFNAEALNEENLIMDLARNSTAHKCSIDEMDNLIWLFGKIIGGSFSLLVGKQVYLSIIERLGMTTKRGSREFDKVLSEKLRRRSEITKLADIMNRDMQDFLIFCSEVMAE